MAGEVVADLVSGPTSSDPGAVAETLRAARMVLPGKQLADGDEESEMIARIVTATSGTGADPGQAVKAYLNGAWQ